MSAPNCPRCKTPDYLRYLDFKPANHYTRHFRTGGGHTIARQETDAPEVTYLCRRCGHFNGHSVPMDWTVPEESVSDKQILAEFGKVHTAPGARQERDESGNVRIVRGNF